MILFLVLCIVVVGIAGYFAGGVIEQWSRMTTTLAEGKGTADRSELQLNPGAGSLLGGLVGAGAGFVLGMVRVMRRMRGNM